MPSAWRANTHCQQGSRRHVPQRLGPPDGAAEEAQGGGGGPARPPVPPPGAARAVRRARCLVRGEPAAALAHPQEPQHRLERPGHPRRAQPRRDPLPRPLQGDTREPLRQGRVRGPARPGRLQGLRGVVHAGAHQGRAGVRVRRAVRVQLHRPVRALHGGGVHPAGRGLPAAPAAMRAVLQEGDPEALLRRPLHGQGGPLRHPALRQYLRGARRDAMLFPLSPLSFTSLS